MFRRKNQSNGDLSSPPPLIELQDNIAALNDLLSETKVRVQVTGRKPNDCTKYIKLDIDTEDRMVELIRRIAEIAVQGEQKAASLAAAEEDSNSVLTGGSSRMNGSAASIHSDHSIHANAVFEYFCEQNVVSMIIDIATGIAFIDDNDEGDVMKMESLEFGATIKSSDTDEALAGSGSFDSHWQPYGDSFVPLAVAPTRIAVQAIQAMSILIQNVKMTTSLYLILSNPKLNDLINIRLDAYDIAEKDYVESDDYSHYSGSQAREDNNHAATADIFELTNIFVTFLKSMAMKMNPETLQFFLSYPSHKSRRSNKNGSRSDPQFYEDVKFPLYERALQFCTPDVETFVRTTAMNICLNILRLATEGDPLLPELNSIEVDDTLDKRWSAMEFVDHEDDRPDRKTNPNSTSELPFKERLTISHFVCEPSRVQQLSSGIFTQLASLCGKIEEAVRKIEKIDQALSVCFVTIDKAKENPFPSNEGASGISGGDPSAKNPVDIEKEEKKIETLQSERVKVVKHFHGDIVSDFQDELYLLEDLLKVGLIPLNEQIIEMMFPTVIYPLILTPIHNFIRQNNRDGKREQSAFGGSFIKHMSRPVTPSIPNSESDSSLAKSALFVIASIFHYIKHEVLLNLLTTVLLHPLCPEVSNATSLEQMHLSISYKDEQEYTHIKTDTYQKENNVNLYSFGRQKYSSVEVDSRTNSRQSCMFVFTPILTDIFQWSMNLASKLETPQENLKVNKYRRTLLSCLSGTDGMGELQSLAIYAIDAIVCTMSKDVLNNVVLASKVHEDIEFRSNPSSSDGDESITSESTSFSQSTSKYMIEFIASLCVSAISASVTFDGMWSLRYSPIAAHAIYCSSLIDYSVKDTATKLIRHRRFEAGKFLDQTPSRLKRFSKDDDKEIDSDLMMDRVFFDPFCDGDTFVVENTSRRPGEGPGNVWNGPAYINVMKDGNILLMAKQICEDISAKHIIGHDCEELSYRCGANSAVSYIRLDAFFTLLKDKLETNNLELEKGYKGVAAISRCSTKVLESRKQGELYAASPVSEALNNLLFDEDVSSSANSNGLVPKPGDIVELVGRKPFPCVCEVTEENQSLITDGSSCVEADGVKWQSLYLVMLKKHMILAELVQGDSGGFGRIVSICPLCCLMAENHRTLDTDSSAQRLLLTHFSPEKDVPNLFTAEKLDSPREIDETRTIRSTLDIWFEDTNSATKAHKSLCSKIYRARIERGKKIRQLLVQR